MKNKKFFLWVSPWNFNKIFGGNFPKDFRVINFFRIHKQRVQQIWSRECPVIFVKLPIFQIMFKNLNGQVCCKKLWRFQNSIFSCWARNISNICNEKSSRSRFGRTYIWWFTSQACQRCLSYCTKTSCWSCKLLFSHLFGDFLNKICS